MSRNGQDGDIELYICLLNLMSHDINDQYLFISRSAGAVNN